MNPATKTNIELVDITLPEGPISIKRYDPSKGQSPKAQEVQTISTQMIARFVAALREDHPINIDKVLGASYNTRSALEALIAHTPQFYFCYPGRLDSYSGKVKKGHKHLLWQPEKPHDAENIYEEETDIVISEAPDNIEPVYDTLLIPDETTEQNLDIDIRRQHARIQVALILIGIQIGYKCWVAQNDKGIIYNNKRVEEMDGVISNLYHEETLISGQKNAVQAISMIDCAWFGNSRFMPAVMEIEHTTGVTSGLTRMQRFRDTIPSIKTRYVVVAPDQDRAKVVQEISRPQFKNLDAFFFPYSAVEELYWLCQRRKIKGIQDEFLECFMEKVLEQ